MSRLQTFVRVAIRRSGAFPEPARRGLTVLLALSALLGGLSLARSAALAAPPVIPAPQATASVESSTPPPVATEAPAAATSPAGCTNGAAFVTDVTVPDNSAMAPGAPFDKTWRIRNSGTCPWASGAQLVFVSGDILGAQNSVAVPPTDPDGTVDVTVAMQAPVTSGQYTGVWQLADAGGQRFGARFTVVIQVAAPTPTVPPPAPLAPSVEVLISADRAVLDAGECTTLRANVDGVAAAWLDGDPVTGGYAAKRVCPCASTVYALRATLPSGGEVLRQAAIVVRGECAAKP